MSLQNFHPNLQTILHRLIRKICDIRNSVYLFRNNYLNPGANKILSKEELEKMHNKNKTVQRDSVEAILLQDILSSILSNTVVLKIDSEGYECKVIF